ncbi:lambda exonuclease family protein [Mycolicibacterium peregrinum]|uniref:lambda exonuclease family protein n=1 Tax=Mycolicibacterium peregrinum TaxID=43304 RepID=UPI003AAF4DFF
MSLQILPNLEQRSPEWYEQRRGIVTASMVGNLIATRKLGAIDYDCPECGAATDNPCIGKRSPAPIKTLHPARAEYARNQSSSTVIEPASNDTSRGLTALLVAERITGFTEPTFINDDMQRGIDDEPLARDKYTEHYAPVTEVGFMIRDDWGFKLGYSPDGLVGDDGLLEIKSRRQKTQLTTILADTVPIENMAQLQCGLLVSGRKWIDYVSWCSGMPMYPKRVYPQPKWFDAIIGAARMFEANATEMMRIYDEAIIGLHPTERIEVIDLLGLGA